MFINRALCGGVWCWENDQLDISNPKTLAVLCAGIIKHENGSMPYSTEQF